LSWLQKCWKWLESSAQFFHSTQNFDAGHPDVEKSEIFSKLTAYRQTMHPTIWKYYEEEMASLTLGGRAV